MSLVDKEKACVFLTGVTGFFGRYLLYQFCEADWVEKVFVLIRAKKGHSAKERLQEVLEDRLFKQAKKQGVSFDNVKVIEGDCLQPKLGISEQDINLISRDVTLVVHNAAALSFASRVQTSVRNNTTPTWNLYRLCCNEFSLRPAFIFISSLSTNSHFNQIPERLIPFKTNAESLHNFIVGLNRERCKEIENFLIEDRLDSYGFSKALAENMIAEHFAETGGVIPVSFVRPGGINASYQGPLKGWIHNTCFYGQLSYLMYRGKIPIMMGNPKNDVNMAPCDLVGNLTMCACLDLIKRRKENSNDVCVINGSLCCVKGISIGGMVDICRNRYPELLNLANSVDSEVDYRQTMAWKPLLIQSNIMFELLFFFINAIVFVYTLFLGRSSQEAEKMVQTVVYVKKYMKAVSPYLLRPMVPLSESCHKLLKEYGKQYPFDASNINRDDYLYIFLIGLAEHLVPKLDREAGHLK